TKKNTPRLADIRLKTFSEGMSVQLLHTGPYSEEPATIKRLLSFAAQRGYEVTGKHHEIYLGDPNRAAAEKLKTLLRYGVRKSRG
ncbi:MAG: GyrI-like domain-containing protein, partial [Coriobacteriia bacterium]|nr:GyrI-like domain-containing protein [Coriobacteriia bacterium]